MASSWFLPKSHLNRSNELISWAIRGSTDLFIIDHKARVWRPARVTRFDQLECVPSNWSMSRSMDTKNLCVSLRSHLHSFHFSAQNVRSWLFGSPVFPSIYRLISENRVINLTLFPSNPMKWITFSIVSEKLKNGRGSGHCFDCFLLLLVSSHSSREGKGMHSRLTPDYW